MAASRLVVRAVVFEPETVAKAEASPAPRGLEAWLGGSGGEVRVDLEVIKPRRVGLLVQHPPREDVETIWWPVIHVERVTEQLLCRYHEGPRGEPWRHRYCTRPAVTRDGYCIVHRSSAKALYERCAQGVDDACREAEQLLGGEEYSIYALDYGGPRVKIGLTQSWRLIWRIAEQPHVSAALVATTSSLLEARRLERSLGRRRGATEGAAARLNERTRRAAKLLENFDPRKAAARLASLLSTLGLQGGYHGYTVLPSQGSPSWTTSLPRLEAPTKGTWRLIDYWGGLLLLESPEGTRIVAPKRIIVHRVLEGSVEEAPASTKD